MASSKLVQYPLTGFLLLMIATSAGATSKTVVLYRFSGQTDGATADGPLFVDRAGNLIGVTSFGGASGAGTIFQLSPPAAPGGKWTETILYSFTGGADGFAPNPGLIEDGAGDLYGTTFDGGLCAYVCGAAFRLSPPAQQGESWSYSVLHSFSGADGADGGGPSGSLVLDAQGNLYGTTLQGGGVTCSNFPGPCGTVFELSPPTAPAILWTENVLHSFRGIPDGEFPSGGLAFDAGGNLYGTTTQGGIDRRCTDGEGSILGCGTVFERSPAQGSWSESVLYSFKVTENYGPSGDLALDRRGDLYGTATYSVFRVAPPAGDEAPWRKQTVYIFTEGIAGTIPDSPLILDPKGKLYGTTASSGLDGFSTAFELSPPASGGPWRDTTLANFGGGFDTLQPDGGLVAGKFGWLYGVTTNHSLSANGYVFAIIP